MSALLRKELRGLLPPWVLAMVLAIVPIWLVWPGSRGNFPASPGYLVYGPFAVGVLLLSLTPFGQELNWGTFSVLLAQPVSRPRIWRIKTLLLALALLLVFTAFCFSVNMRVDSFLAAGKNSTWRDLFTHDSTARQMQMMLDDTRSQTLISSLMVGGLGALAGFAGGLWTTLLFRQVSAAFWLTLLVPVGLSLLGGELFGGFSDAIARAGTCALLTGYSAAGFLWARNQFQQVQDTQWTGGVVSLPDWRGAAAQTRAAAGVRKRRAMRALLVKELQSQYVNFLLAGVILLIHLAVLVARRLNMNYLAAHRGIGMTLESFPVLWLAMPLLIGSVAIAEERKLGTFETVSCVPVARWRQFLTKMALALILGLFFGGVMPLAIEHLGAWLGLSPNASFAVEAQGFSASTVSLLAAFGISLLAFFGSSLTRNTLQALASGVLACIIGSVLLTVAAHPPSPGGVFLWNPWLLVCILVPVIIVATAVLAFRNYRRLQLGGQAWLRNGLVLLALLLGTTAVTSAVYHRFWEAWLPLEPRHEYRAAFGGGPRTATTPKVAASHSGIAVVLSDGRLWLRQRPIQMRTLIYRGATHFVPQPKGPRRSGFVPGTNWREVATTESGCFAIQADGSLWDLSGMEPGSRNADSQVKRVGDGHDWNALSGAGLHYSALQSNGTLWEWGRHLAFNGWYQRAEVSAPTQVGTDTDWVVVADCPQGSLAVKADGTIWRWGEVHTRSNNGGWTNRALPGLEKWLVFPGAQRPVSLSYDGYAVAAVTDDGSLWIGGQLLWRLLGPELAPGAATTMVRWGTESDWKSVQLLNSGMPLMPVALKRDGSMWKWDMAQIIWHQAEWVAPPFMPASHYAIWTSTCPYRDAFLALGRDDSLCVWGDPEHPGYFNPLGLEQGGLLLPSRIHAREIANLGIRRD